MRWWSAAVAMVVLAASRSAIAETPPPRSGVYASGALGFGAGLTRESVDNAQASSGSFALDLHAALGYAPLDGLALAADGRIFLQADLLATVLGGLVDWYPAPRGPWHVELGLGRMSDITPRSYGANDSGGPGYGSDWLDLGDATGVLGHAGVGYTFREGRGAFSPTLVVFRARETSRHARLDAYGALLELSVVRF